MINVAASYPFSSNIYWLRVQIASEKRINDLYKLQLQLGSYDDHHHINAAGMSSKEMMTV